MKNWLLLFLSVVISVACTINLSTSKTISEANPMIFSERVGENLFVFRQNESNKIVEYILIQGTQDNPAGITDFSVSSDGREASLIMGANTWVYSLDNEDLTPIYGIGHFIHVGGEGVARGDILQDLEGLATGGGKKKNCDTTCGVGGCGSSSCSKTIWHLSCSITCSNGYFACCADMVAEGCHCKKDDCCDATPSAPTIKPGN